MASEVMILNPEEIKAAVISENAANYYRFLLDHAGIEMDEGAIADFIVKRNGNVSGLRDLAECKAWMKKAIASIDEVLKHSFNVGTADELPKNVKWSKQSYTYEFAEGAGAMVANALVSKKLVTKDALLDCVTVTNVAKASGLTVEKIMDMFPDTIVTKPKAPTLSIK